MEINNSLLNIDLSNNSNYDVDKLLVILIEEVIKDTEISNILIKKLIDNDFIKNKKILKNSKKKTNWKF